ncbi:MAG: hypothetical protein ACRDSJ_00455 [Rubrobacteraceae bacterium]
MCDFLVMKKGFPKIAVRFLVILFVSSLIALLSWFAYLASRPVVVPEQFGVTNALLLTAVLSGACSLASGLLAYHYRQYSSGEAVIFGSCLIVSTGIFVCSGVWSLAIAVFEKLSISNLDMREGVLGVRASCPHQRRRVSRASTPRSQG